MFKTNEEIIIIQAKAATPIPTGVVFWSHDKGTAKMLFQLQKDYVNQTLSEGTIVPICLDFVGGRHIYHAVIEDAINGIVSIVLEDNILGYVGRVTGSIYIELPDSRSLDTAGRFTFDIKRSPIDLNTPELEDYYWQGFNEIIDEYHQTINTIKSEAKALIDSLTADVTEVKNDIATANVKIAEIRKKLDDNDVFTKAESSANVIYQLIGKETVKIPIIFDFEGKIATSNVENPHKATAGFSSVLPVPSQTTGEVSQNAYNALSTLDGNVINPYTAANKDMTYLLIQWNVLEAFKRILGDTFFIDRGATTVSECMDVVRLIVKEFSYNVFGYGTGPSGNSLNTTIWNGGGAWSSGVFGNKTNTVSKISRKMTSKQEIEGFLNSDGNASIIAYSEKADGATKAAINVDYVSLDFTIEISANEHAKSMIAANHVGNLATQEEAVMGEDNTKTMTPLRVNEALENKTVSITGNQTVGGIKNFRDGLLLNDIPLSSITRKVVYEADGIGGYFNQSDKFILGVSEKIDRVVLLWSRVDDVGGTLLNYSWSQTVLSPDDIILGYSYRLQLTNENYKFVTFANEMGKITISGANENSVAPNRIYRIKRIISYIKD